MTQMRTLVDGANLRGSLQRLGNARIDAQRFCSWAASLAPTSNAHRVDWFQAAYPNTGHFFAHLRQAGVHVTTREPKVLPNSSRKANMDVEIAMKAAALPPSTSTVLLCSGDGDFLPLVENLMARGTHVLLLAGDQELDRRYHSVLAPTDLLRVEHELRWFEHDEALRQAS